MKSGTMTYVELVGIPGAGKSTIASALTSNLSDSVTLSEAVRIALSKTGHDAISRLIAQFSPRLWSRIYPRSPDRFTALTRFMITQPRLVETVLAAHRHKTRRGAARTETLGYLLNMFARYQILADSGMNGIVVNDEGFAQRAIMIFANDYDISEEILLKRYISLMPKPDILIYVETPIETCQKRVASRAWTEGVLAAKSPSAGQFLANSDTIANFVVNQLNRETTVLTASGLDQVSTVIPDLVNRLR